MPIAGLVISFVPEQLKEVRKFLEAIPGVEIYGWNEKGEMVIVLERPTLEEMERETKEWPKLSEGILSVNVAYMNVEDLLEKIEKKEYIPERPWK